MGCSASMAVRPGADTLASASGDTVARGDGSVSGESGNPGSLHGLCGNSRERARARSGSGHGRAGRGSGVVRVGDDGSDSRRRAGSGATSAPQHHVDTLFDAYGKPTEQVGYTDGHYCLTKQDREEAARCGSSLLYGEILASGVTKLLDEEHLHAAKAQVLYDLGMGVGKLCLQAFLQFPSLRLVFGIELAYSRYKLAEEALVRLVSIQPDAFEVEERVPGEFIRVHTLGPRRSRRRVIELRRGNMWTVRGINAVDIVVLHTELTLASLGKVRRLVGEMRRGARFVTYQDLSKHQWCGAVSPSNSASGGDASGSSGKRLGKGTVNDAAAVGDTASAAGEASPAVDAVQAGCEHQSGKDTGGDKQCLPFEQISANLSETVRRRAAWSCACNSLCLARGLMRPGCCSCRTSSPPVGQLSRATTCTAGSRLGHVTRR